MSEPILVEPPGRLSTTNCCPRFSVNLAAMVRAVKSVLPPAANGTMMRTDFVGYVWALAEVMAASSENTVSACFLIIFLPQTLTSHYAASVQDYA